MPVILPVMELYQPIAENTKDEYFQTGSYVYAVALPTADKDAALYLRPDAEP